MFLVSPATFGLKTPNSKTFDFLSNGYVFPDHWLEIRLSATGSRSVSRHRQAE
jgi:hypothetical protein